MVQLPGSTPPSSTGVGPGRPTTPAGLADLPAQIPAEAIHWAGHHAGASRGRLSTTEAIIGTSSRRSPETSTWPGPASPASRWKTGRSPPTPRPSVRAPPQKAATHGIFDDEAMSRSPSCGCPSTAGRLPRHRGCGRGHQRGLVRRGDELYGRAHRRGARRRLPGTDRAARIRRHDGLDAVTLVVAEVDAAGTPAWSTPIPTPPRPGSRRDAGRGHPRPRCHGHHRRMVGDGEGDPDLGWPGLSATAFSPWMSRCGTPNPSCWDCLWPICSAAPGWHPIYGSGGLTSYPEPALGGQLAGWVAEGITRVKMKVGRDPVADPARVCAARDAIGDDADCSWTPTAPTGARRRSRCRIYPGGRRDLV